MCILVYVYVLSSAQKITAMVSIESIGMDLSYSMKSVELIDVFFYQISAFMSGNLNFFTKYSSGSRQKIHPIVTTLKKETMQYMNAISKVGKMGFSISSMGR